MEPSTEATQKQAGIGPIAGTIIVVLLFIAGGIYFLIEEHRRLNTPPIQENINI